MNLILNAFTINVVEYKKWEKRVSRALLIKYDLKYTKKLYYKLMQRF